jgi:PAS domain S-box-containing protein
VLTAGLITAPAASPETRGKGRSVLQIDSTSEHNTQASEGFVQSALDALSGHIAILDEHGVIIGVNAAWRRFAEANALAGSANYGLGCDYLAICDTSTGRNSKEAPLVAEAIRQIIRGEADEYWLEYPCHSKTEKRWFIVQVARFEWGGAARVMVAHQNVTTVKRVQLELDESRKRIETILNNVANGIVTVSARGRLESVNPAAAQMFGYPADALIGELLHVLFAEPYRSMPQRKLLQLLESEYNLEMIGQHRDGTPFPMLFIVSATYLGNRRLYTGIIHDITERKRIEVERIERERLAMALDKERELREFKSRFISMMSHELRTPLASILLSSDLMRVYGDKVTRDERDSYLDNIHTQVDYLTSLIKEMVSVTTADVNLSHFAPQIADLVLLCRQIVDEYRMTHGTTHTVKFASSRSTLKTRLDVKLMRSIITNLLSNAIKYSPQGTDIALTVERNGPDVCLQVSDSGIGIPAADLPQLFEPFHRASNVGNLPGTGLGLAVVKQSVELHNGQITVESQPGRGSTFTVTLPHVTTV